MKFFATEGVDYGKTGWITEKGEFIECASHEHDSIAAKLTEKDIDEVEKQWIRISVLYGKNHIQFAGNSLTKQQHKALDDWGIMDFVERKRALLTPNFCEAYFNN